MVDTTIDMNIIYLSVILIIVAAGLLAVFVTRRNKKKNTQLQTQSVMNKPINSPKSEWDNFEVARPNSNYPSALPVSESAGGTEAFKKFSFNIETMVILSVVVGIMSMAYARIDEKGAVISLLVGGIMFVPIGVMIGALFSGNFRIKIVRRLTGKNFGFVKFMYSNKLIKPVIANLDGDIVRFADGVYLIDKQSIRREGKEVPSSDKVQEQAIKFEEGIPTIFYDVTDIMPIDFKNSSTREKSEDDTFRLPTQVSATLNKEIAVEKAKIMKAFRNQQNLMTIVLIVLLGINLFFSYSVYNNNKNTASIMTSLNSKLDGLSTVLQALATAQQPAAQPPVNIYGNATH